MTTQPTLQTNTHQTMPAFGKTPDNFEQAYRLAKCIASSDFAPPPYKGKANDCLVAMEMGAELGLTPMQALQNIAVIKGRPCLWGDAMLALVKCHTAFEDIQETFNDKTQTAICMVKRKKQTAHTATFSLEDAKRAGLSGRGVWLTYPKRMLQMRARGFALRDVFPDALKGLQTIEEISDFTANKPATVETIATATTSASQADDLAKQLVEASKASIDKLDTATVKDAKAAIVDELSQQSDCLLPAESNTDEDNQS